MALADTRQPPQSAQAALIANLRAYTPDELRAYPHFVGWQRKSAPTPNDPNHTTKVPKVANIRGKLASAKAACAEPKHLAAPGGCQCAENTWRSFDEALHALASRSDLDGVGFVMNVSDPFAGIDLDHCLDPATGELTAQATAIIETFASYAEYSPSGDGVHILIQGRMPNDGDEIQHGRKRGGYEAYSHRRFYTLTGKHIAGTPHTIEPRQEELDRFIAHYLPTDERTAQPTPAQPVTTLDDRAVIERASRAANGMKFQALWSGGAGGATSESEADEALCCLLRFWVGDDAARIDSLFRQSGRYTLPGRAEKWNSRRGNSTYGGVTVAKAIAYGGPVYSANYRTRHSGNAGGNGTPDAPGDTPAGDAGDDSGDSGDSGGYQRPQIVVSGRQLRDIGADALAALVAANTPAVLFHRNGKLARVRSDEHGRSVIEEVTDDILRARLADVADFGRWVKNPDPTGEGDELLFKAAAPPIDIVSYINAQETWPFPPLVSVTEAPVMRPDGSLVTEPGYDAATMLYYAPSADLRLAPIPATPTIADVVAAKATLDDVLDDFPYDSATSRAHAYALLLTAVIRPAIAGMVPLALLTAPVAGTGKTLLASLVPAIASGRDPAMMAAPDKEEEWVKLITSMLLAGPSFALIDNISGTLKSSSLELLLTSPEWQQRMLGANRMATLKQRAVWVATGNNIQLAGDLPRRCYRIRLDAKMARPERRSTFKHRDIVRYARKQRGKLLSALLTLARSWYADNCPTYDVTPMGSYEDWARIVGSILAHAGIDGFLANLDEMYAEADSEGPQWAAFFAAWHATYGGNKITTNVLAGDASNPAHTMNTNLPETLAPVAVNTGALTKRLGYELRKHVDVRYDLGDGNEVYLTRAGTGGHNKVASWRVIFAEHHPHAPAQADSSAAPKVRVIAGDVLNSTREKRENDNTEKGYAYTGSYGNHPQSPAHTPPAQADSSATPAGDTFSASPARCPHCGDDDLRPYGNRLHCHSCDAMLEQGGR